MLHSPITEHTFRFIVSSFGGNRPVFIACPSKKKLGLSLSVRMLKEFWTYDLSVLPNEFQIDDIITITIPPSISGKKNNQNASAKVVAINHEMIKLRFIDNKSEKGYLEVEYRVESISILAKVDRSETNLSTYGKFEEMRHFLLKADTNNNPWSKFLGVDYAVSNSKLCSKVYFISGRGNVEQSRSYLERVGLYDTLKDGLMIKESLKDLADRLASNQERQNSMNNFIQRFNDVFRPDFEAEEEVINETLVLIQEMLVPQSIDNVELRDNLQAMLSLLENNGYSQHISLKNIINQFLPNINANSLDITKVKSVIIDGVELAAPYSSTIRTLIAKKIPVTVLSDYANFTQDNKELIRNFRRDFPESYVLNWNKAKISLIHEAVEEEECLDKEAYILCRKYRKQNVVIEAFNDDSSVIDRFFTAFEIRGLLRRVEGFEGIKNVYTIHLRPIVYWIKNIPGQITVTDEILDAVNCFRMTYDIIRDQLNAHAVDVVSHLDAFLGLFDAEPGMINNSKKLGNLPNQSKYFNQTFYRLGEQELPLPYDEPENSEEQTLVVFTGTPFEERKYFYLLKTLFEDFEDVYFLGFCKEAESVYNRFLSDTNNFNTQINDNVPANFIPFWNDAVDPDNNILYLNENCLKKGNVADDFDEKYDFDKIQEQIELDRYRRIETELPGFESEKGRKEKVNILELEKGMSVFLPKKGGKKIFVLTSKNEFVSGEWEDINVGDRVFTYSLTRQDNLKMRGKNSIEESVFVDLDFWYEELRKMWLDCGENFSALARKLQAIKNENSFTEANPEPYNLRNWLRTDRHINAPERDNLYVILRAARITNFKEQYKKIMVAKRKVERLDDKNREAIKKQIQSYCKKYSIEESEPFTIIVNPVPIVINHGIVKLKLAPADLVMEHDGIGIIFNN